MAPPERIALPLPETLPDDFADWDREESPAPLPGAPSGGEDAQIPRRAPKPADSHDAPRTSSVVAPPASSSRDKNPDQSRPAADRDASPSTLPDKPRNSKGEIPAKHGRRGLAPVVEPQTVRELTASEVREADEILFQMFSERDAEVAKAERFPKKMRVIVSAVGGGLLLIALSLTIWLHHGAKAATNRSIEPHPEAAGTSLQGTLPDPSAGQPSTQVPPATTNAQPSNTQLSYKTDGAASARVPSQIQSGMMDKQLSAPSRITRNSPSADPEESAPSGWTGTDSPDGAAQDADSVFSGHTQPVVARPKPPVISSGVATGMLIHRTAPVYPLAAKAAHVAGTVEVQATIAKDGTIREPRAVNGPELLRQAAVDAVRTWRYKPYELNHEPVEVETTVEVIFSLGG